MRIHLCGKLRVEIDGANVEGVLGGRQGQLLFAYLVLNRFRELPRSEVISALRPNGASERVLTTYLSKIRRAVGGCVEGRSEIRLALPPSAWVDVEAAEEKLLQAEGALAAGDWAKAFSSAHVALYIAERDFFPGCDLAWAVEARHHMRDILIRALESEAASALGAGAIELPEGEKNARRAVALAPFRESAHRVLMEVLEARGNEAEALRVYGQLRERLQSELGTAPGRAVEEVRERLVKEADPSFSGGATTRTFMFTDVVASTNLLEVIGDDAWQHLRAWHDQALGSLFAEHDGEEVDHTGDGFFVAFPDGGSAVRCAIAIQRRLSEHRREHGFAPHVRIGLHTAAAVRAAGSYTGRGVHEAARIGALGGAGDIVASVATVEGAGGSVSITPSRTVELKGIAAPVEVVTIDWS
jgi:SARP family transcriptional regulator, regulator of embCAB operon